MTEDYPLLDMETLVHKLEGSKFYVKIDLSSAYYRRMLDEAAQVVCVINTTLCLLKLLRLPQGIENASQRTTENTLKGFVGTICFQDDLLVHERTKSHVRNVGVEGVKTVTEVFSRYCPVKQEK